MPLETPSTDWMPSRAQHEVLSVQGDFDPASCCSSGFKELCGVAGVEECLRVIDEKLAAVFEPERFAYIRGGTMGVFKFSQMATQLDANVFYLAAEAIREGSLEVEEGGALGGAVARVAGNKCGCVFQVTINSAFEATKMKAIMCGDDKFGTNEENACNTEKVANPRPLTYANQFEYLLIGEDSDYHANNMVWAWDPETGKSTRIFHSSLEGRITSLTWFQDVVGGNNYIGLTIADPFDRFGWLSYFGSFDLSRGVQTHIQRSACSVGKGPQGAAHWLQSIDERHCGDGGRLEDPVQDRSRAERHRKSQQQDRNWPPGGQSKQASRQVMFRTNHSYGQRLPQLTVMQGICTFIIEKVRIGLNEGLNGVQQKLRVLGHVHADSATIYVLLVPVRGIGSGGICNHVCPQLCTLLFASSPKQNAAQKQNFEFAFVLFPMPLQ